MRHIIRIEVFDFNLIKPDRFVWQEKPTDDLQRDVKAFSAMSERRKEMDGISDGRVETMIKSSSELMEREEKLYRQINFACQAGESNREKELKKELKELLDSDEYRREVARLEIEVKKEKDRLTSEYEKLLDEERILLEKIKPQILAILDKNVLKKIIEDEAVPCEVRHLALRNPNVPEDILRTFTHYPDDRILLSLAENSGAPSDVLEDVARAYLHKPENSNRDLEMKMVAFRALISNSSSTPKVFEIIGPVIDNRGTEEDRLLMRKHPNYKGK